MRVGLRGYALEAAVANVSKRRIGNGPQCGCCLAFVSFGNAWLRLVVRRSAHVVDGKGLADELQHCPGSTGYGTGNGVSQALRYETIGLKAKLGRNTQPSGRASFDLSQNQIKAALVTSKV